MSPINRSTEQTRLCKHEYDTMILSGMIPNVFYKENGVNGGGIHTQEKV